jgi:hypothetical protein
MCCAKTYSIYRYNARHNHDNVANNHYWHKKCLLENIQQTHKDIYMEDESRTLSQ